MGMGIVGSRRCLSEYVFHCVDVFRCKEVRAMVSSKRHIVTLMSVELLYVRRGDVRTSIATNLPGE